MSDCLEQHYDRMRPAKVVAGAAKLECIIVYTAGLRRAKFLTYFRRNGSVNYHN